MPPFLLSPVVKIALGAIGGAAVAHWAIKEVRRINHELERMRAASSIDPVTRRKLPTLRRDPHSGEWRIG
jgi:hypothetical protein